ncbi:hypothetical protein G7046_g1447 [Stylonectria norvegica]|nr:hypothetical protein G7046_g1447 [Stylonectria norvegica]
MFGASPHGAVQLNSSGGQPQLNQPQLHQAQFNQPHLPPPVHQMAQPQGRAPVGMPPTRMATVNQTFMPGAPLPQYPPQGPPPMRAIPQDLLPERKTVEVSDIRSERITEADARDWLSSYVVLLLEKTDTSNDIDTRGYPVSPTWEKVYQIEQTHITKQEATRKVRQLNRETRPVHEKKDRLESAIQRQLELAKDKLARTEKDPRYEYTLAQFESRMKKIDDRHAKHATKHKKDRKHSSQSKKRSSKSGEDRVSITAYFKRRPRSDQNARRMLEEGERQREMSQQMPIFTPPQPLQTQFPPARPQTTASAFGPPMPANQAPQLSLLGQNLQSNKPVNPMNQAPQFPPVGQNMQNKQAIPMNQNLNQGNLGNQGNRDKPSFQGVPPMPINQGNNSKQGNRPLPSAQGNNSNQGRPLTPLAEGNKSNQGNRSNQGPRYPASQGYRGYQGKHSQQGLPSILVVPAGKRNPKVYSSSPRSSRSSMSSVDDCWSASDSECVTPQSSIASVSRSSKQGRGRSRTRQPRQNNPALFGIPPTGMRQHSKEEPRYALDSTPKPLLPPVSLPPISLPPVSRPIAGSLPAVRRQSMGMEPTGQDPFMSRRQDEAASREHMRQDLYMSHHQDEAPPREHMWQDPYMSHHQDEAASRPRTMLPPRIVQRKKSIRIVPAPEARREIFADSLDRIEGGLERLRLRDGVHGEAQRGVRWDDEAKFDRLEEDLQRRRKVRESFNGGPLTDEYMPTGRERQYGEHEAREYMRNRARPVGVEAVNPFASIGRRPVPRREFYD